MTRAIHDALFKRVFSETENARSFLQEVLPPKVVARLDWGSLDRRPESYVDEVLRSKYSDLVFSVRLRGERRAFVYLLFEHQREPDDVMPFRLLVYMTRIWQDFLANHPKERLPVILPIVLSQGPENWRAATRFIDLLDIEPEERDLVAGLVPDFAFVLQDLSHISDEELQYIFWASKQRLTPEAFNKALEAAGDPRVRKIKEVIVSVAEMLEQKGRNEGLRLGEAKGRAEAKAEDVLAVLGARDIPISVELQARIRDCDDLATLDRWLVRAATAKSAAEVLGE